MADANGVQQAGRIKWFNTEKGYGFIAPNNGGPDVFLHKKHLTAAGIFTTPKDDEAVLFSAKQTDKGLLTTSIRLTEKE